MDDQYTATIKANAQDLSIAQQKKAGQAIAGDMDQEHREFFMLLMKMMKDGVIDVHDKHTFMNEGVYTKLPEEEQDQVDLALVNIATQLRIIKEFHDNAETPDQSPQLQTMVEQLWDMKERIEVDKDHDVFVF